METKNNRNTKNYEDFPLSLAFFDADHRNDYDEYICLQTGQHKASL